MTKKIKRKNTKRKRPEDFIIYSESLNVEGVGEIEVKADGTFNDKVSMFFETIRGERGLKTIEPNAINYMQYRDDPVVDHYYKLFKSQNEFYGLVELEVDTQKRALNAAYADYNDEMTKLQSLCYMIVLLESNFIVEDVGGFRRVKLKDGLEPVPLKFEDFKQEEVNELRRNLNKYIYADLNMGSVVEQRIAIIDKMTSMDSTFFQRMRGILATLASKIQEVALAQETDEMGFQSGGMERSVDEKTNSDNKASGTPRNDDREVSEDTT